MEGEPIAVPHAKIEGGVFVSLKEMKDHLLLLHRDEDASFYASTTAVLVPRDERRGIHHLVTKLDDFEPFVGGFDTFWYSWIAQNAGSRILP